MRGRGSRRDLGRPGSRRIPGANGRGSVPAPQGEPAPDPGKGRGQRSRPGDNADDRLTLHRFYSVGFTPRAAGRPRGPFSDKRQDARGPSLSRRRAGPRAQTQGHLRAMLPEPRGPEPRGLLSAQRQGRGPATPGGGDPAPVRRTPRWRRAGRGAEGTAEPARGTAHLEAVPRGWTPAGHGQRGLARGRQRQEAEASRKNGFLSPNGC